MGGYVLTLTCKDCNSKSGGYLDHHQKARATITDWWNVQETDSSIDVAIGDVRGTASVNNGQRFVTFNIEHNKPGSVDSLMNSTDKNIPEDEIRLGERHRYSWQKSRIADLKDAYLWLFCMYGYSYIASMGHELDIVQSTIRNPGNPKTKKFCIDMSNVIEPNIPKVFFDVRGFPIVSYKGRGSILPSPICPNVYDLLDDDKANIQLAPKYLLAPTEMKLSWDFLEVI